MKMCPICEIRSKDAEECPKCGRGMVEAVRLCRCGKTTSIEKRFCSECGQDLSGPIYG
jgi:predicted amidophosphoribosyltransferase